MTTENEKRALSNDDIETEIRRGRKFTADEALGRLAGPGAMKGASAISPQQQAENAVWAWLEANVVDSSGSLREVLFRQIRSGNLILGNVDEPLAAVAAHLRRALAAPHWITEIAREADVQWGRTMGERPRFERPGAKPDCDDPYTVESVRNALERALNQLSN